MDIAKEIFLVSLWCSVNFHPLSSRLPAFTRLTLFTRSHAAHLFSLAVRNKFKINNKEKAAGCSDQCEKKDIKYVEYVIYVLRLLTPSQLFSCTAQTQHLLCVWHTALFFFFHTWDTALYRLPTHCEHRMQWFHLPRKIQTISITKKWICAQILCGTHTTGASCNLSKVWKRSVKERFRLAQF